ncbi:tryptophan halogenase family protein [Microbulbifer sp. SAOS-129_SWC]|uniref:tryptophan halogenase family protein n=1 Tax=Microbulbifer sp. SAOS-129_SWC TaxID=3145235 RepID=UPI003217651F
MNTSMQPIRKIVIVGGGSAGWIAAAVLGSQFSREQLQVELVESEEIGTIGVGESTIPPFLELLQSLNIDERDFIQQTQASFKLGIEFSDWRVKGESYFHPFGTISAGMDETVFYQSWLKSRQLGDGYELQDFSPASVMASQKKFMLPQQAQQSPIGEARYALHLDAKLVADYLRRHAENNGVKRTEGRVTDIQCRQDGFIDNLTLANGEQIHGDFFIDCSGFRALLIEKTLGTDYSDWSHYLPCDRAVTIQTESTDTPPYTRAGAKDAGWMWRIPLQRRTGNGYVYASKFCSDDEALQTLLAGVEGKHLTEPHVIPFRTGVRREGWKANCLSLGLASGFIEPLESTAIHLVVRGMVHFMRNFPDRRCDAALVREYNRRMLMDYEEIRDFIVMHYCLTRRDDTPFWRWWQQMERPQSLQETLDYFAVKGELPETMDPLFAAVSWRSVCEGMGLRPQKYSALIDKFDPAVTRAHFERYLKAINEVVQKLPGHAEFIQKNCPHSQETA